MKNYLLIALIFVFTLMISRSTYAQQAVQGTVYSFVDNDILPGVTIILKGTSTGTTTDVNGKFTISANPEDVLVFSYVGYTTEEIEVGNRTNIEVRLTYDLKQLQEIVVTGYMTEKRADITGAVSVVKMNEINSIPSGNIMSVLQGRIPGVSITTDGTPGGMGTTVNIRGLTTINQSTPLYVVDGVQTRADIATLLNSNDVESIQVLKDAASASIYGTQAANGVVIITTKRADSNQIRVNFDGQFSSQHYHSGIKMLDAQQWGDVYWKAYQNDGFIPSHDIYGNGPSPVIPEFIDLQKTIRAGNTNWADEVYKTSLLQNYNLSVFKGSDNGSTMFSFNYYDHDGLIKHTNFTRYNVRFNSDYKLLNNKLRIGENINVSRWDQKLKPGGIEELTIAQHPIIPVYDINGGYAGPTQGLGDKPNPVRLLNQQKENRNQHWRIFGNIYAEIEPVKNLVARTSLGLNYRNGFESNFSPKWSEGDRAVNLNSLYSRADYHREWVFSNTLNYRLNINNHDINAVAGIEAKEDLHEYISGTAQSFIIEDINYRYLGAGGGEQVNDGLATRIAMASYFGKVNYSFMDRYLVSATIRQDASSRFGSNNNSALFPAVSFGWRLSEESFLKDNPLFSELKLRGAWGRNGNDLLDPEATYTKYLIDLNKAGYDLSGINQGTIANGIRKILTGNSDIKWEVTTQANIGVDVEMMNARLTLALDYYIKQTEDMLIYRPYIATIGEGGDMAYNGASMDNNGFEGIVSWRDRISSDFSYNLSFTTTAYKNKITYLPEDIYYTWGGGNGIDKSIVGQPYGSWMGYKTDGLFRTDADLNSEVAQSGKGLGRIRYVDVNNDKIIDNKDRTWLGSDQPKFTGGLNVGVNYKDFDLTLYMMGMVRDAYNNSKFYTDFFQLWTGNHSTRLLEAWDPDDNFNSNVPALTAINNNDEGRLSEYFIEDGSFVKLKNLVFGYTLPKNISDRLRMQNARVYLQAQDLFTLTKYSGADPEGLGYPYPLPRAFTFGFNIGF